MIAIVGKMWRTLWSVCLALSLLCVVLDKAVAVEVALRGASLDKPLTYPNGEPMVALAAVKNVRFLTEPSGRGRNQDKKPDFLEVVTAYNATSGGGYYLVHNERAGWGWIARQDLLMRLRSLTVAESEREGGETAGCSQGSPTGAARLIRGENPNLLKVIVKNDWRLKGDRAIEPIALYSGPDAQDYRQAGKVNVFRVRYAYKICDGTGSDNMETKFVFVGNHPFWDIDFPAKSLSGWVDIRNAILWPTRIAVWYDETTRKERPKAVIFDDEQALQHYQATGEERNAKGREDQEAASLEYFMTRYPVLADTAEYAEIAWISGAVEDESGRKVKKEVVDRKITRISDTIDDVRNRDILFVMDATSSMGAYFEVARDAIDNFIEALPAAKRGRYRFAVAIYRDYGHTSGEFELISDFSSENVVSRLSTQLAASDGGDQTMEEAVFNGIVEAVQSVSWGNRHTRAVVLIGDHGNHRDDARGLGVDAVVEALESKLAFFHSINVMPRPNFSNFNALFIKQVDEIISTNSDRGGHATSVRTAIEGREDYDQVRTDPYSNTTGHNPSTGANGSDLTGAQSGIIDALVKIDKLTENVAFAMQEKSEGTSWSALRNKYGTIVTEYMLEVMKAEGLSDEDIEIRLNQFVEEGWVLKQSIDGVPQLAPWVLVGRTDLTDMANFLTSLKRILSSSPSGSKLSQVIGATLYRMTGDKIEPNERLSDYLGRIAHIPFKNFSALLQYTPDGLVERWQDRDFRVQFKSFLCQKTVRLNLVLQRKEARIVSDAEGSCQTHDEKIHEWWWTPGGEEHYAWIPMDYLP